MHKAFAPDILFSDEIQCAKSYALYALVTVDACGKGIKRLLTKSRGPPKLRVLYLALCICHDGIFISRWRFYRHGNLGGIIGLYRRSHKNLIAIVPLCYVKIGYSCRVFLNKVNRFPNSHIGKIWPPIPTKHTVCFTNVCISGKHVRRIIQSQFFVHSLRVFMYAMANDL